MFFKEFDVIIFFIITGSRLLFNRMYIRINIYEIYLTDMFKYSGPAVLQGSLSGTRIN